MDGNNFVAGLAETHIFGGLDNELNEVVRSLE
jgi:hypothetical protein